VNKLSPIVSYTINTVPTPSPDVKCLDAATAILL